MHSYDVTILTLVYNHKAYLPQLFISIASQNSRFRIEWYLIDDASPDGSAEEVTRLIATLPANIDARLLVNEKNQGVNPALTRVMSLEPHGRYSLLLEGDDYWHPDYLTETIGFLDENPDYGAVHTDVNHYLINEDRFVFDYWQTIGRNTGSGFSTDIPVGDIFDELLKHNFIQTCSFIARTDVFYRHMRVQEFADVPYEYAFMDYPYFLGVAQYHKIGFIKRSLATYRVSIQGMNANPANRALMHYSSLRMVYDAKHGRTAQQ
jgi:glycosyltransferase involved in cell wall biosynthesis